MTPRVKQRGWRRSARIRAWGACALAGLSVAFGAAAQPLPIPLLNPVYLDESPAANDAFVRVTEHLSAGNLDEAVRVLQGLIETQGDRVVASTSDPDVFLPVRTRAMELILSRPEFLKRYRTLLSPRAERIQQEANHTLLERTLLLTPPGFDAALRLAQSELEDAAFEACRLRLTQLTGHPDCTGDRASTALGIATQLLNYLDRPDTRLLAERFAKAAGATEPKPRPVEWPDAARAAASTPLSPLPPLNSDGLVPKPLWTVNLDRSDEPALDPSAPVAGVKSNASAVPSAARELLLLPTVAGDTVVVSDGTTIEAWDRFTLSPRWKIAPGIADLPAIDQGVRGNRAGFGRVYNSWGRTEELGTVAAAGRIVLASTGRGASGMRDSDDRLHAIDAVNGQLLWSVHVPSLDASLADAAIRGPAVVVENTVVLAARKNQTERRLMSVSLVGLSLATGELKWVRSVGSAGSPQNQYMTGGSDTIGAHQGMVYRSDKLGVVCAVEAATGRAAWIRRVPADTSLVNSEPAVAWQIAGPIVDDRWVTAIAPDTSRIIRLDRATGALLAQRRMSDFGVQSPPKYLLVAGSGIDRVLVGVGDDRLYTVRMDELATGPINVSQTLGQPAIRGRVSVIGDRFLLVPTASGADVFDALAIGDGKRDPVQSIALASPGQVLALERQLLVVDDRSLHSYLLWDVAEQLLLDRIKADPKDPGPPVTYAELAYRAGKPDRIGRAVEMAMETFARAAKPEVVAPSRARLLEEIQNMVVSSIEPGSARAGREANQAKPIEDRALLRTLVERMGQLANGSDDSVSHLLALGRLQELDGAFEQSVETYQRILEDQTLSAAIWRAPQLAVRADLESTRRIESLVRQHGASIYAAMERRAEQEIAKLGPDASIDALELVVARYPLANASVRALLTIAQKHEAAGRTQQMVAALEGGVRAAQRNADPPKDIPGALAGRLLAALRARQQNTAAAGLLRTVRAKFPGLTLTLRGEAIDQDRASAELADNITAAMRWARVGAVQPQNAQAIPGLWQLEPLIYDPMPGAARMLALSSDDAVSLWAPPTAGSEKTGNLLTRAWMREITEDTKPYLVKTTPDAAYFVFVTSGSSGIDGFVEKVGGTPATSRWRSESLAKLLARDDSRGMRRVPGVMVDEFGGTPGDEALDPRNMLVTMDDRTLVIVQRSGVAAGIDTDTGEVLWRETSAVGRVYDAQVLEGTLVIAGSQELRASNGEIKGLKPMLHVLDARTGKSSLRISDGALTKGTVHWVRLINASTAIVGLEGAVANIDLSTAQTNWTIANADLMPTVTGWLMGENLVLLAPDRGLWLVNATTGRMRPTALGIPKSHIDSTRSVDVFAISALPGSGFGVATQQGLALFTAEGELVGVDGFGGSTAMVPPRAAEGRAVTVETIAEGRNSEGLMMFSIHGLDLSATPDQGAPARGATLLDSRPILLGARPVAMSLLDDHVVVTAGSVTIVLKAPGK